MTPNAPERSADDDQHGLLSDAVGIPTAGLGFPSTGTAQVSIVLPAGEDDDDLTDDEIVADEIGDPAAVLPEESESEAVDDEAEAIEAELVETGPFAPLRGHSADAADDAVDDADDLVAEEIEDALAPDDEEPAAVAVVASAAELEVPDVPAAAVADATPVTSAAPVPAETPTAAVDEPAPARAAAAAPASVPPVTGPHDTRWARSHPDDPLHEDRAHAVERVTPPREVSLNSRRIGEFEPHRESADLLTADRLLDPQRARRGEPEGAWQQFVYALSGGRLHLGDGRRARERKELDRRIAAALPGGAKFVPVLSRKGGVGKTTVTTLLGMALADARDDRVIAVDANPDRGTLADRFERSSGRTVRDLVRRRGQIKDFHELSAIVARDETRLDVLASDTDPRVSEAFSDRDYHDVATVAAHYYSIVVTDTGTGVVHSVMGATLDLADQIVVVAGLSVDEARLASEMLTWLETNGYAQQVREAVVVLNNSRPGSPLVRRGELEAHFRTRVRAVITLPYDTTIAAGSAISFRDLHPATREAARRIAAEVVGGLASTASAA